VGTTSVPEGFAKQDWGFVAVLPKEACTGATIAMLGSEACEPIDDCSAPFPSADATVVVRADGTPAPGRPNVRVVKTLGEAIDTTAPLATIAVDEGEYALPAKFTTSKRIIGRCAERTSLRGTEFGVSVDLDIKVSLASLGIIGSTKAALILSHDAVVDLDRVYVHGANGGAVVGNWATLTAKRTVFEAPARAPNPNAALTGIHATYDGDVTLSGVEIRGYQLAIATQSKGTTVTVSRSVLHEQRAHATESEALSTVGAFLGAVLNIDQSYVESGPGRIAMIGAARLDGQEDPTSPGDPPGILRVTNSALVQTGFRREAASGIDVIDGASLELDNVTVQHDSYVGLSAAEGATLNVRNTVIGTEASAKNARMGLAAVSRSKLAVESTAIIGSAQFAILLDDASSAEIATSLIARNHEVGIKDFTMFMGSAQAIAIAKGGTAKISDSAFVGNEGTSIYLQSATAEVNRTVFDTTVASQFGPFTAGITAIDATLVVRGSTFSKNDRALALRGGRALLAESAVADHREAVRLDGLALLESAEAYEETVDEKLVVARTTFVRNAIRVSEKSLTAE
jgi:hypothetical protein